MRIYVVLRYVALTLLLNALFMGISALISLFSGDGAFLPLLYGAIVTASFGVFPLIFVPPVTDITNKEGLLIVVTSWLVTCLFGTLPYILWGGPFSVTNAWFESVSGFTTTGSTILANIEAVPKGLLFWRAATHWIGGIGIIVFVMAVLPFMSIAEMVLYRTELSSLARDTFHSRARKAIQIIAGVYLVLTVLETVLLMLLGMSLFDAITHAFATIATGGFSPRNASVAYYHSPAIEFVIIVFMVLSGMNFLLLFHAVSGKIKEILRTPVLIYYLLAILTGVLVTTVNLSLVNGTSWLESLRHAAFNVISVSTSTGFASTNTAVWPVPSQILLMFFALQCACSGSTSGGIKADRIYLLWKGFKQQLKRIMHPNAVLTVRAGKMTIADSVVNASVLYIAVYLGIVLTSTMLLSLLGVDFVAAISGTIACMGNVGPGLGAVGSTGNFTQIPDIGKLIYSAVMLLGRVEIYALFIVFTPAQWRDTVSY
jgi:trk system potassium uptake protein TrkH